MVAVLILISGGLYFTKFSKKYPEESAKDTYMYCFSDKGFYYVNGKNIWFYDMESGKKSVLCNKANCEHNSEECNAYIYDIAAYMLYYDDNIYVSYADVEITNKDGDSLYSGYIGLDCISADGSKRKNIYSADNGSVSSMKIIDGILYYTTFEFHGGYKENVYIFDSYLYKYDLRWNKSKCIAEYMPEEGESYGYLTIVPGDSENIYMNYMLVNKDGTADNKLLKYDNNEIIEIYEDDNMYTNFQVHKNVSFIFETECFPEKKDLKIISELDLNTGEKKEIMEMEDAAIFELTGWLLVLNSDYNKILYRIADEKMYVANTCFTEEGTYISDVYDIDEKNNRIYIDLHDYTGILPGTIFYEDVSDKGVAKFDAFLEEFFTPLEEVDESDLERFEWVEIMDEYK